MEGIELNMENTEVLTEIFANIQGPDGTPYEGGEFSVKLVLGASFPQSPPKGFFLTPIFHPNVGSNGEICVNTLKRDWSEQHKLKHVLIVIRCLLIYPNPDSALNEEAGRLIHDSYNDFFSRAQMYTNIHAKNKDKQKENSETSNNSSQESASTSQENALNPVKKSGSGKQQIKENSGTKRKKKGKKKKKNLRRL